MKKNIKILVTFGLLICFIQCKSQQFYPLNTSVKDIPQGGYVKDTNNELVPFIGIYKAVYQGNEITLNISRAEYMLKKRANQSYFMDALIVKYTVKNSSGVILQDTQNNNSGDFYSIWSAPEENAVVLYYPGTNCGVGWGKIYLFKKTATQLSWDYHPNDIILDEQNCPGNQDIKIYLPVTKDLIFTKQ
jgi:hypothetical protein